MPKCGYDMLCIYRVRGPKVARRRLSCGECGREIPRGSPYYTAWITTERGERRRVVCRECARAMFIHDLGVYVARYRREVVRRCVSVLVKSKEDELEEKYVYLSPTYLAALRTLENEAREKCEKKHEWIAVKLPEEDYELARILGVDLEEELKKHKAVPAS